MVASEHLHRARAALLRQQFALLNTSLTKLSRIEHVRLLMELQPRNVELREALEPRRHAELLGPAAATSAAVPTPRESAARVRTMSGARPRETTVARSATMPRERPDTLVPTGTLHTRVARRTIPPAADIAPVPPLQQGDTWSLAPRPRRAPPSADSSRNFATKRDRYENVRLQRNDKRTNT